MTMSLVLSSVEVAAGPTVGLADPVVALPKAKPDLVALPIDKPELVGAGFTFATSEEGDSSETSSIGVASSSSSSSDDDDRGSDGRDEAESKPRDDGALASLDSLEESLPIKRGLSNYFTGKSKSFASLSECANSTSSDLAKPENPFNKRRRILMAANKNSSCWSRRASCSSLLTQLPPLQGVEEGEEEEDERGPPLAPLPHGGKFHRAAAAAFKSPRSFSLSDLQHA